MKNNEGKNSMIRWKYQGWLENAEGLSESTIRTKLRAITIYEDLFKGDDFANYNHEKAKKFKEYFDQKIKGESSLSQSTYKKYLMNLKMFFDWLSKEPGYKSKINNNSLSYLKPSRKILAIASGRQIKDYPTIEDVSKLVNSIVGYDEVSMRSRALISFTLLTGMRADSIISIPLSCINLDKMVVIQDPRKNVRTKFSKTIQSIIFNFDDELVKQITLWYNYLIRKGFEPKNPLFPRSKIIKGINNITYQKSSEVIPEFWKTPASMRDMFKKYAIMGDIKYYPPHSFRHSCIKNAVDLAKDISELKAISQNFGHDKIETTLAIYGQYSPDELVDKLFKMTHKKVNQNAELTNEQLMETLFARLKNNDQ